MKLSDTEKNNRLSEVFLKKSDREYDQYVSGDLNKQDFEEYLKKISS